MVLNEAVIPHFQCSEIPISKLKQIVSINEAYLREKSTWYIIENALQYFKIRNDYRLFTEQFFSEFGRQIMGLDTLDYRVSCVRVTSVNQKEAKAKTGLLSTCFQDSTHNYYLISELLNSEISDLVCYSGYSLVNVLDYLKQTVSAEDYDKCKTFLLTLFVSDGFMLQADRNYHNIGFEIPKIEGVSYSYRLRPELLALDPRFSSHISIEGGIKKLKGFAPSKVYDSEKILGVDHKNVFTHKHGMVWAPLFPCKNDLLFATQAQAEEVSQSQYDGLDPNLTELYMAFPDDVKPLIERLAYDDEYRKILENFSRDNSQIHLLPSTQEYFETVLKERREVLKKVLSI